ncbi:hypothetical protein KGF56_002776 [Candida oxycetoniae]|uniref:Uncharacterized protein n=1 Tax=Candida oxycetoniae TaxID=497107 RepID=A0AAI9WXV2_9ASCO|nr:uncharacterized protein KGF56_002776 [Candida oxycetoniae]KAI3404379.2 hypothetical protein KGF56_002776 [Candida oxycetoniae]
MSNIITEQSISKDETFSTGEKLSKIQHQTKLAVDEFSLDTKTPQAATYDPAKVGTQDTLVEKDPLSDAPPSKQQQQQQQQQQQGNCASNCAAEDTKSEDSNSKILPNNDAKPQGEKCQHIAGQSISSRIKNVDEVDIKQAKKKVQGLNLNTKEQPSLKNTSMASHCYHSGGSACSQHSDASSCSPESRKIMRLNRKVLLASIKSWLYPSDFIQGRIHPDTIKSTDSEELGSTLSSDEFLTQLPNIPVQYRPKEINGFGILSQSQSLPVRIKKQFELLLTTAVQQELEFCKYMEILHERSKNQDIRNLFLLQFDKMHATLPFTNDYLALNDEVNEEMLLQLKVLFGDIFNNNYTVWIVNKFEYNGFSRKFRKVIADVLRTEYQFDISYRRESFYRQVIAASLIQWRRHIPFAD